MRAAPSPLYQLIEERLPGRLVDYVAERRATKSWKEIAPELSEAAGIAVSWETLRGWFADRIVVETQVRVVDQPDAEVSA